MPTITLPDNSTKSFPGPVTAKQVAESIGARLAQAALGCKIDGELRDLSTVIDHDCKLAIVTPQTRDKAADPDGLFLIRHSAAHVMAEAIQRVFGNDVQLAYGPPLATGFYYDMAFPSGKTMSSSDFAQVEAEMKKIIAEDRPFTRYEQNSGEGLSRLRTEGNKYKIDNAERALAMPSSVYRSSKPAAAEPEPGTRNPALSFYATGTPGQNWEDLCRGPHVPSTAKIGAFKVTSIAGAYWHGDETKQQLQRVYGTAFPTQKDLDQYLNQIE
ncbi:MAG: TGS domain-containing protein, partial [Pyrinomonadaceae bacterium]|nr:TGS domain-containing protein [Phycisphaerales bacterium]